MKATGIVRRIDACVIIGQNPKTRMNTGVALILSELGMPRYMGFDIESKR